MIAVAAASEDEWQQWSSQFERAKMALIKGQEPILPQLNLFYIGTILVTVLSASQLPLSFSEASLITLQLNNQSIQLGPASGGSTPKWNQSIVLSMVSFDDCLLLNVARYHKYAPPEPVGRAEMSLNFLEYYDQKSTDIIKVPLRPRGGQVLLQLQFHSI